MKIKNKIKKPDPVKKKGMHVSIRFNGNESDIYRGILGCANEWSTEAVKCKKGTAAKRIIAKYFEGGHK